MMKRETQQNPAAGAGTPALQKRRHLQRLETIFDQWRAPIFFITTCVRHRQRLLHTPAVHDLLLQAWQDAVRIHEWAVGRYVVMPDHVHFFAAPCSREARDLSDFVGGWKHRTHLQIRSLLASFAWQKEFFDHLLRSDESYGDKWKYVRLDPVRAGLVGKAEDWPYQGEIHPLEC